MTNRWPTFARRLVWSVVPMLCLLLLLGGCDDGALLPPDPEAGTLFTRYVALGNSITAGFQSDGINAETQAASYAVRVAQQMGHELGETFNIPALAMPGCPPPLTNIFTGERRGGGAAQDCRLRTQPIPTTLHNVAVPGAALADVLTNTEDEGARPNPLTMLILGGRTQVEVAEEVQPTFASVWIGNNDVLSAALAGNVADGETYTPPSAFEDRYEQMIDRLTATGVEGGVLVGVADVTLIPYLSAGAAYFQAIPQAQQAEALPPNLAVANACETATEDQVLVPFRYGIALVNVASMLFEQAGSSAPTVTLDCAEDSTVEEALAQSFGGSENIPVAIDEAIDGVRNVSLLQTQEIESLRNAVQAYNTTVESAAEDLGWPYVNPNTLFEQDEIAAQLPAFPELFENPDTPWGPDQPFGPYFSQDGVHPSTEGHALIADALIQAINGAYDVTIPLLAEGGAE